MDLSEDNSKSNTKIVFKKRKNTHKNLRNVIGNDDSVEEDNKSSVDAVLLHGEDNDDSVDWQTLDELKTIQRMKRRNTKGINILDLMKDNNVKTNATTSGDKKFGGLTDAKTLANELDLGNTFSLETNRRDEDAELMKYVEEELAKRRSKSTSNDIETNSFDNKANSSDDMLLRVIPENLLKLINETKTKNEEMLSSQMLSGIPEVNLGIEERIRNIEKTEAARAKLLEEKLHQENKKLEHDSKDKDASFVPKNFASCFVRNNNILLQQNKSTQNHRFNMNSIPNENKDLLTLFNKSDVKNINLSKPPAAQTYNIEPVVRIGDEPQKIRMPKLLDKDKRMPGKDKPSDDYIFEKFKKQLKKY